MTKLEALIICRDMWTWLAQNPWASKNDYLTRHPHVPRDMEADCSCCHYSEQQNKRNGYSFSSHSCETCPLIEFFRNGLHESDERYSESTCLATAYGKWLKGHRDGDTQSIQQAALSIANAAAAEIAASAVLNENQTES